MAYLHIQGVVIVYLKRTTKKNGRVYYSIADGYWDKDRGHTRTKTIESIGYHDELVKQYEDPYAHFSKVVKEMNRQEEMVAAEYTISARKGQRLEKNTSTRRNYGYIIIMSLYYELGLDGFLINRQRRNSKLECNTSTIMKMLVINRILSPGSKKRAFEERGRYFDFEKKRCLRACRRIPLAQLFRDAGK